MPANCQELLIDYIPFYENLNKEGENIFEDRLEKFLQAVKITGAGAEVEDLDKVLIGAAAVIPVYYIPGW